MQEGRGVKIVIFMALRCKVMKNTRKTGGAWGKSFSRPPRGPEKQQRLKTRLEQARYRRSNSASNLGRLVLDRAFLMILRRFIA